MNINEEIKQKSFNTPFSKTLINLFYTNNQLITSLNEVFKSHHIQGQHFNVLRIVKGKHPEPITPGEIKDVMLDKGRDLTRLLDKLENSGYILRCTNNKNRRMVLVSMTPEGIAFTNRLSAEVDKWQTVHNYLTDTEAETLSDLLDKMRG